MHKSRSEYRDGYKAHLAVEPETGIVTACKLTPANASDAANGTRLIEGEDAGLQVLGDGAYGSGDALAALREAGHQAMVKPFPISAAGGSAGTISPSTNRLAPPPAPPVTPSPSPPSAMPSSVPAAPPARCARRAPPARTDAPCACTATTPSWSSHAEPGETATSPRTTGNGGPW